VVLACREAAALEIISYLSPWNQERPIRPATYYIILHTTEGLNEGSLKKIHNNGEAHFYVDPAGRVYRIIQDGRVALHTGRSMWNGRSNIDLYSIGIEVCGFYNKDITPAQYKSLRELIALVKEKYKVSDERVLTHSMVAYGAPNAWHSKSHRGRKRCGMIFAKMSVRSRIGLEKKPGFDPDVREGRLVVGDPYLAQALFGSADEQEKAATLYASPDANVISKTRSAWDIAGDKYKSGDVVYQMPDGTQRRGNEVKNWKQMQVGTKVVFADEQKEEDGDNLLEIGVDGKTAQEVAGEEYGAKTTIYFLPDGKIVRGDELTDPEFRALSPGTKVLVGYTYGGRITPKRSAYDICGKAWNYPSTYYRLSNGSVVPGSQMKESQIPKNAVIFFRN
jgi:hypothetical protein